MTRPVPRAPTAAHVRPVDAAAHRHRWAAMRFELEGGHAWVLETCAACGHERRYRAFERFWDPARATPG